MEYVIMNAADHFWCSPTWSSEYPNADKYRTAREAKRIAARLADHKQVGIKVVRDYGLATEKAV